MQRDIDILKFVVRQPLKHWKGTCSLERHQAEYFMDTFGLQARWALDTHS